jgi:hypothetical protein
MAFSPFVFFREFKECKNGKNRYVSYYNKIIFSFITNGGIGLCLKFMYYV